MVNNMLVIGHRGASGYLPENTAAAFEMAIAMGVDMVEFDVRASKSGEIFLLHDDTLERTTNGKGVAYHHTMPQLRSLDAGKGQRILTLPEVLDIVDRRVKVNIEIKATRVARRITKIIQYYVQEKGWKYEDFLVSSFQYRQFVHFKKLDPKIPLAAILDEKVPRYFWRHMEKFGCKAICLSKELALNSRAVERAHEYGIPAYIYTVNTKEDLKPLKAIGVNGVFTDYPDRFIKRA